jgi:rod shape-determining protein MreD
MLDKNYSLYFYSSISLFMALLLQIIPVFPPMAYWRPQFLLLVVFYWLLKKQHQHGVTFAWLAGMLLDIFSGQMLGRHAIAFSLSAYVLVLLSKKLYNFGLLLQASLVFFVVLFNQLLMASISLLYRTDWNIDVLVASAITSALTWPFLSLLMNGLFKNGRLNQDNLFEEQK